MSSKKTNLQEAAEQNAAPENAQSEQELTPEEAKARIEGADRFHSEALGMPWAVLLGANPEQLMPQVVATVLHDGGTRPVWQWTVSNTDFVLMAWPKDQPSRAAVVMAGKSGSQEQMKPADAFPLLEGLPNNLLIDRVYPWKSGIGGDVAATMIEGRNPMWFYDPLFERDRDDLTPGVTQGILLSGLAFSVRKALIDEMTITKGPAFEAYASQWLEDNPGQRRIDVPPLKIPMTGRNIIMPGRCFSEYQMRCKIDQVDDCALERMPIKVLYVTIPFEDRAPLIIPVYAPKSVLKDYEPKAGDEIDLYVWLQGRIVDAPAGEEDSQTQSPADIPEHKNPLQ